MLPDDHPDRIQIAFDDRRLVNNAGLILPRHAGPAPGPTTAGRPASRPGRRAGPSQHRRQDCAPSGLRAGWRRLH